MSDPRPLARLLVDMPRFHLRAGAVGTIVGEALISKCVTLLIGGRYITFRSDQVDKVTDNAKNAEVTS